MTRNCCYLGSLLPEICFVKITTFPYVSSLLHLTLKFVSFLCIDHDGKETLPVLQYLQSPAPSLLSFLYQKPKAGYTLYVFFHDFSWQLFQEDAEVFYCK